MWLHRRAPARVREEPVDANRAASASDVAFLRREVPNRSSLLGRAVDCVVPAVSKVHSHRDRDCRRAIACFRTAQMTSRPP